VTFQGGGLPRSRLTRVGVKGVRASNRGRGHGASRSRVGIVRGRPRGRTEGSTGRRPLIGEKQSGSAGIRARVGFQGNSVRVSRQRVSETDLGE